MPEIVGVLETALHVEDVERAARFYEKLFGFKRLASDDRFCAFSVADKQVLLLFRRGGTLEPLPTRGGVIPPHDSYGRLHFAFAITASELRPWEERLAAEEIPVESKVRWGLGGQSIYFRDLDGHLVELATPGIWPIY